ncbi:MAG: DNA-directed polymerase, omega subunit [Verrucomicrobiaceae bacterium]|nr:DNA-directed polymerase, omega subunit [Verrucomicrobiaceae bacterium]
MSVASPSLAAPGRHLPMKAELVEQAALIITDPPILINLVSKRVRQLAQGRPALVQRLPGMREADVALTEIIQGKIRVQTPEDVEASGF